jgi:hypothetical protein
MTSKLDADLAAANARIAALEHATYEMRLLLKVALERDEANQLLGPLWQAEARAALAPPSGDASKGE